MAVDLSTCVYGDLLISSHGTKLKYIRPTNPNLMEYLDHVVEYLENIKVDSPEGRTEERYTKGSQGTRTDDGFVFKFNRKPETDHDIVEIIYQ